MNINLYQYEVMDAIQDYVKKEYGIDVDLYESLSECPLITTTERDVPYKKYKNGKVIKDEQGLPKLDFKNATTKKKYVNFGESDEITIFLEPGVNNDR